MLNGNKIEKLIDALDMSREAFFKEIGISKGTMHNIMNGTNSPSCANIEKIADYFKISIDYFFDRKIEVTKVGHQVNGNGNNVSGNITLNEYKKEIEHLQRLVDEKERTIQILMDKQDISFTPGENREKSK